MNRKKHLLLHVQRWQYQVKYLKYRVHVKDHMKSNSDIVLNYEMFSHEILYFLTELYYTLGTIVIVIIL